MPPNRSTPKRGAQKGRKRKQESESEEEASEEEEEEPESDDSDVSLVDRLILITLAELLCF